MADAGCMTIGVSVASEKQSRARSLPEDGSLARGARQHRPPVTALRRLVAPPGPEAAGPALGGGGRPRPPPQHGLPLGHRRSAPARSPTPRPLGTTATTVRAGTALCACFYLRCPRSHLNSPRRHHTHPRHSVSALLFDETGGTGEGRLRLRPAHAAPARHSPRSSDCSCASRSSGDT